MRPRHFAEEPGYENAVKKMKRRQLRWRPKAATFLMAAGLLYVTVSLSQALWQQHKLVLQKSAYQAQIEQLSRESKILEEQIAQMETDSYVEKVAREELGLVLPGEKLLVPALPGKVMPRQRRQEDVIIGD